MCHWPVGGGVKRLLDEMSQGNAPDSAFRRQRGAKNPRSAEQKYETVAFGQNIYSVRIGLDYRALTADPVPPCLVRIRVRCEMLPFPLNS